MGGTMSIAKISLSKYDFSKKKRIKGDIFFLDKVMG